MGCILACKMTGCTAFEFDVASAECKLSSRMHQFIVAPTGSSNSKPIYMQLDAVGEWYSISNHAFVVVVVVMAAAVVVILLNIGIVVLSIVDTFS